MRFTTQLSSQIFLKSRYAALATVHQRQLQQPQQTLQQRVHFSSSDSDLEMFDGLRERNEAADRNAYPISNALRGQIENTPGLKMLEIASGTGKHCSYFAPLFPNITFQPTEVDTKRFVSITAHAAVCETGNINPPLFVDVSVDWSKWPERPALPQGSFDYMFNCNMMHITPWICSIGLFRAASQMLKSRGKLFTYGPYAVHGVLTPCSNYDFDLSLKRRNPEWGIRDVTDLKALASDHGLELVQTMELPSENKFLVWRKLH